MTLLVDTSVWSLALRRDAQATEPEVRQLKDALLSSEEVVTTGLILQELRISAKSTLKKEGYA
jgi:predicted nucleic acid-binding protein